MFKLTVVRVRGFARIGKSVRYMRHREETIDGRVLFAWIGCFVLDILRDLQTAHQ